MTMEDAMNFLSALPEDSLFTVVSFLDSRDTLRLSELSSSIQDALSLSTLHDPSRLIVQESWFGSRDEESNTPRRSVWIPVLLPCRTHSVVLTCTWRDQGFGNRKGALYIVAVPIEDAFDAETLESIENGKTVYESPLAPHEEESLRISFSYCPSKAYYLWYRVGGGGGHQLRVRNLVMHMIIYDTPGNGIGRNYQALQARRPTVSVLDPTTSVFSLKMLRLIATLAQQENTQESTTLLDEFFDTNGFDTSQASLKALQEIANALLELDRQKKAHASLSERRPRGGVGRVPLHGMNEFVINGHPAVMNVVVNGQVHVMNGQGQVIEAQDEGFQALNDVVAAAERFAAELEGQDNWIGGMQAMMADGNVVHINDVRGQQEQGDAMDEDNDDDEESQDG